MRVRFRNFNRVLAIVCFHGMLIFGIGCRDNSQTIDVRPKTSALAPSDTADAPKPSLPKPSLPKPSLPKPDDLKSTASKSTVLRSSAAIERGAAQLCQESLRALQAGETQTAYELARLATRSAPKDPQVIYTMALVFGQQQRFPEAIRMFDQLAESEPSSRIAMRGQTALWMVMNGQWEDAESRLRSILDDAPDTYVASRQLAQLLVRQGRRSEAAAILRELCRRGEAIEPELRTLLQIDVPFAGDANRESFEPIGRLGNLLMNRSEGKSVQEMLDLILESSHDSNCAAMIGRIYAAQDDFESLDAWLIKNPVTDSIPSDAWFAWGIHQSRQGNDREAVRCFCETVLRDPTDAEAYLQLSEGLSKLDAKDQSQSAANRARLLRQTQTIGAKMSTSNSRDQKDMAELARLLDDLNRPFESLGWRSVQVGYAASQLSDLQLRQVLNGIAESRLELLSDPAAEASQDFILCGVDIEAYRN